MRLNIQLRIFIRLNILNILSEFHLIIVSETVYFSAEAAPAVVKSETLILRVWLMTLVNFLPNFWNCIKLCFITIDLTTNGVQSTGLENMQM